MKIQAIECTRCKGELKEKGKYWECPYCGAKFSVQLDADGDQIIYRNDAPKELPCGQVAERAAQISVDTIASVDIKPPKTIESDVYKSSDDLDYYDNVNLITMYLKKEKWDIAQDNICKLRNLNDPCSTAVADWYGMAWEHKVHNDSELVHSFTAITDDELQKLYNLLLNAMPDFRKRILDLVLSSGYVGDESTNKILVITLPFLFSELIYSPEERDEKIEIIFDKTISLKYAETFKYLLTHALESHEVDRYIGYLERFADNCDPESSQEYYSMIISVYPGNAQAHHSLVNADIKANSSAQKCIDDFENLLLYSQDPIKDVETFITVLINEQTTTEDKAEFMWALLSYLHEDTETQTEAMSLYANLLLQSELWNRASEFYSAVLSRDTSNAKVYFNLCLADMQAKDTRELIAKEDDFSGHPYYKKALAQAYKTSKIYAKELEGLIDSRDKRIKDEQAKKKRIRNFIFAALIIVVIGGIIAGFKLYSNNKKYNEANISFIVTSKEYPYDSVYPCHFFLDVNVKNNSSLEINRINGIMRFYNDEGELLYESNIWLTGNLEPKKDYNYELEIEQYATEETTELHNTPLSSLKITWELTKVTYENNEVKEYTSGKEYVINEITNFSDKQNSQEKPQDDLEDNSNEPSNDQFDEETIISQAESLAATGNYDGACELLETTGYNDTYLHQAYKYASEGNFADAVKYGLTVVVIPEGVETIPDNYFKIEYGTNELKKVVLPTSIKSIGTSAFYGCAKLVEIDLPSGLKSIGNYAFAKCKSLKSIEIPNSVENMGSNVFQECTSLQSASIPGNLNTVPSQTFMDCSSLTTITLQNGIEILGIGTFSGCTNLVNITLPDSLVSIESNAFYKCYSLVEITIPAKVNLIRYSAFSSCSSLLKVYFANQEGWQYEFGGTKVNVTNDQDNAKELRSVTSSTIERK